MLNDIELDGSVWWNGQRKRNRVVTNGNLTMDKIVKNTCNINRLEPITLDNVTLALSTAAHKTPVTVLARGWRSKFVYINPQKCTRAPVCQTAATVAVYPYFTPIFRYTKGILVILL